MKCFENIENTTTFFSKYSKIWGGWTRVHILWSILIFKCCEKSSLSLLEYNFKSLTVQQLKILGLKCFPEFYLKYICICKICLGPKYDSALFYSVLGDKMSNFKNIWPGAAWSERHTTYIGHKVLAGFLRLQKSGKFWSH